MHLSGRSSWESLGHCVHTQNSWMLLGKNLESDYLTQCSLNNLIGASLSEPHTSESNGGFFIYYIFICRTSFRKCRLSSFNPKHCARRSVRAKNRKQCSTLEPFHFSYTDWPSEAPKPAREQEDRRWRRKRQSPTCCRDSRPEERKVEKLRVRDRARRATQTASERQATLQRKSTWKKPPRREERG